MRAIFTSFPAAILIIFLSLPTPTAAQQVIKLKDKTTLRGQVLEMTNGTYRIKTTSMGEVRIPADQILAIIADVPVKTGRSTPSIRDGRVPHAPLPETPASPGVSTRSSKPAPPAASGDLGKQQQQVNTRVQSMMMDGDFGQKVIGLSESEGMQDILGDPELMNLIQSGDYQSLMNNEKMQKLMESQEIQDLLGDVDH